MESEWYSMIFFLDIAAFVVVILMHLVRRNANLVRLYIVQSLLLSALLFSEGFAQADKSLLWIAALTLFVKAILAPTFFFRLLNRFGGEASATNYLSNPMTLLVIMILVTFAHSKIILPLGISSPEALGLFSINLAMVLVSIFLLINRRGVLTQIVGILSLESSIVFLASLAGARQSAGLEAGILFDMAVWIIISVVFVSMIHRQFGSLNVSGMKKLIEE